MDLVTSRHTPGLGDQPGLSPIAAIAERLDQARAWRSRETVHRLLPADVEARLRAQGVPQEGRPLEVVVEQMLRDVYPYRGRADHPRFFAFIPGPVSPVSVVGDLLTAAHNPHAGSWLESSGPSAVERDLIAWLAGRLGLPESAGGLFVSGGSMANLTALVAARDARLSPEERTLGVCYVSDQTHSSVAKGLRIIGFLDRQIRKLPVDANFRLDANALAAAVAEDKARGLIPFAVVASAGTTNTGAIDPLARIADICAAEDLWMHVDGAYGASLALSETHRHRLAGIERADSISWDAHKWLFQTYGCGMVFVRDRARLTQCFSTRPEYLEDADVDGEAVNFWDLGPELTRPARGLKLWLTLQTLGVGGIARAIDHGFALAERAEAEIRTLADWRIVSPANLAIVNFRFAPEGLDAEATDRLNTAIAEASLADGFCAVLTTRLMGRTVLRICAINPETTEADIVETIRRLDGYARAALRR
jgi:glutamate/tyrosine decarboxylase-like PLP-dependent enzyme